MAESKGAVAAPEIDIAQLIEDVTSRVTSDLRREYDDKMAAVVAENAELNRKLGIAQAQVPSFKPMQLPEDPGTKQRQALAAAMEAKRRKGILPQQPDDVSGKSIPVDMRAQKLPHHVQQMFQKRFTENQAVRINPEAVRIGWPDWVDRNLKPIAPPPNATDDWRPTGEVGVDYHPFNWGVVLRKDRADGIGYVRAVSFLADDGEWQYICVFPRITNIYGFHFAEHELAYVDVA